jgi:hypothetical protein
MRRPISSTRSTSRTLTPNDYFGLPPLLVRMPDDGRGKPLTLIGQRHVIEQIWQIDRPRIRGSARPLPFRDRNASKPPRGTKSRIASLLCSSRRAVTRRQITRFERYGRQSLLHLRRHGRGRQPRIVHLRRFALARSPDSDAHPARRAQAWRVAARPQSKIRLSLAIPRGMSTKSEGSRTGRSSVGRGTSDVNRTTVRVYIAPADVHSH